MGYSTPLQQVGAEAAADLSAKTFYAVRLNGSGKLALCGAGEAALGLLLNKPESGRGGDVGKTGIYKGILGGTVTEMDLLASDSSGKLVKWTPGAAPIGVAMESGVSGNIIAVDVICGGGGGGAAYLETSLGAEAGNAIVISAQLKAADGTNVAAATPVRVTSYDAGALLTAGGVGSMPVGTGTVEGIFLTSAAGALEVTVTDAAAETVYVELQPHLGLASVIALVFA